MRQLSPQGQRALGLTLLAPGLGQIAQGNVFAGMVSLLSTLVLLGVFGWQLVVRWGEVWPMLQLMLIITVCLGALYSWSAWQVYDHDRRTHPS